MRLSNISNGYDVEPVSSHALNILSEPTSITTINLNSRFIRDITPQIMNWLTSINANPMIIQGYTKLFDYGDKLMLARQANNEFVKTQDIDFWTKKVTTQAEKVEQLIASSDFRQKINDIVSRFNTSEEDRIKRYVDQSPNKAYL